MRTLIVLLFAVLVAAGGCLDDRKGDGGIPDADDGTDGTNETADTIVTQGTGTISAGFGTPVVSFQNGGAGHEFTVAENATALIVEVTWESDQMDIDLALKEPNTADPLVWQHQKQEGMPGAPDNPHSIRIEGPATGGWQSTVFPNGAAADTTFTIYASVFFEAVPDGYTAIP